MSQDGRLAIQRYDSKALPGSAGPYLLGVETALLELRPGDDFPDEYGLARARLTGQQERACHFSGVDASARLFALTFSRRRRCFSQATLLFLCISQSKYTAYKRIQSSRSSIVEAP